MTKPGTRPVRPWFSSGPCAKRPGWSAASLDTALVGRAHRSAAGKARLALALQRTREVLEIPADYRLAIVPGSDTGAIELALWSLLGARGVDVLAWDSFGQEWMTDIVEALRLLDVRRHEAPFGSLPDLRRVDCSRDVVFVWNGTSSGVRVPHADWIDDDRAGLTLCDATSAAFAMRLPWHKLDVTTFSWQKALGGEAAHGMLVLSPRAVERLLSYTPPWPLPKLFRLTNQGQLIDELFVDATLNTPSMLCVEDWLGALNWATTEGGIDALIARSEHSLSLIADWVSRTPWVEFLAEQPASRSCTSVCLKIVAPWFIALPESAQRAAVARMTALLEAEQAAYDIAGYRRAPPGLRIWTGATIDPADVAALLPWLDWALEQVRSEQPSTSAQR